MNGTFAAGDQREYLKLVVKQLRAGKTGLTAKPRSTAASFVVDKAGGAEQREVWNGAKLSSMARRPPKPPYLANPGALTGLEADEARRVYASVRDGKSFFDQLKLPQELSVAMCRPGVRLQDILGWCEPGEPKITMEEVLSYVIDEGDCAATDPLSIYYPASLVFPMGFSWSSYVAQSTMLHTLVSAGIGAELMLSEEHHLPVSTDRAVSLATDDVVYFSRMTVAERNAACSSPLELLDRVWQDIGLEGKAEKKADFLLNATILGIALHDGIRLMPRSRRFIDLVEALVDLLDRPCCTPRQFSVLLGVLQWHNLLARPTFSALGAAYGFAMLDDCIMRDLPGSVLDDVIMNVLLCPAWVAELDRPWSSTVVASDASTAFGFGVCAAQLDRDTVRALASEAGDKHHIFRLLRCDGDEPPRPRDGATTTVPLFQSDFKTVISHRARRTQHSGSLEASAVVLGLRRLLRSPSQHRHRLIYLVDATAIQGSLRKGRTSAGTIRRQIRQAAALQIATGVMVVFLYVPSEDNPADKPSRGVRPAIRGRKLKKLRPNRLDALIEKQARFWKYRERWPCRAPTSLSAETSRGTSSS